MVIRPKHAAVTEYNIQTSVALDGNPEPDLVHATGCKQQTLRFSHKLFFIVPTVFERCQVETCGDTCVIIGYFVALLGQQFRLDHDSSSAYFLIFIIN
jgi:hypothetical protein